MSSKNSEVVISNKTLAAKRTYRVSTRMVENFPQIVFFVSPVAHRLFHLQLTLFPTLAGKKEIKEEEMIEGFRTLDQAIILQFNRDLANYARIHFSSATQEELVSTKFGKADGFSKRLQPIAKSGSE